MAKVTQAKRVVEDEEPDKHIAAEGQRILKDMVSQQLDTSLTIDSLHKRERLFVSGAPLDGISAPFGAISSASFSALQESEEVRLKLLGAGVDPQDVEKLYAKGKGKVSGPESLARQQLWNEAAQKLLDADSRVGQSPSGRTRLEKELRECVPATGIHAHLVQSQKHELLSTSSKPADSFLARELQKTEKELFNHLDSKRAPSAIGRKRRRDRKIVDSLSTADALDIPQTSKISGSLWDVKSVPAEKPPLVRVSAPVPQPGPAPKSSSKKNVIGCSQERLFTIKDGVIMELKGKRKTAPSVVSSSTRMTIDDIRAIPKFSNYEPGEPNKVLFVKNFPSRLTETELLSIFSEYFPVECRLMTGKMKGQAFVTFSDEQSAQRALDGVIGISIDNKPLIIQFGRSQPSDKSGT